MLTNEELARLKEGLAAAWAVPFIDDIEDFIWEAIFAYAKGIPITNTLNAPRSKLLFDVVDQRAQIGWSAKALQWPISKGIEFELVIQRADVIKKARELGFPPLTRQSPPAELGRAVLAHWERKIVSDSQTQHVKDCRTCVLLKANDRRHYAFYEAPIHRYTPSEITWKWTNQDHNGLQGLNAENFCVFRWYPGQTQLFHRYVLDDDSIMFELEPHRSADHGELIRWLGNHARSQK